MAISDTIGVQAARVGCVVGIQWPERPGEPVEVAARDRVTYELRCWGCGCDLDGPVTGTTMFGRAGRQVEILLRACDACLPPETRSASA